MRSSTVIVGSTPGGPLARRPMQLRGRHSRRPNPEPGQAGLAVLVAASRGAMGGALGGPLAPTGRLCRDRRRVWPNGRATPRAVTVDSEVLDSSRRPLVERSTGQDDRLTPRAGMAVANGAGPVPTAVGTTRPRLRPPRQTRDQLGVPRRRALDPAAPPALPALRPDPQQAPVAMPRTVMSWTHWVTCWVMILPPT